MTLPDPYRWVKADPDTHHLHHRDVARILAWIWREPNQTDARNPLTGRLYRYQFRVSILGDPDTRRDTLAGHDLHAVKRFVAARARSNKVRHEVMHRRVRRTP